MHSSPHNPHPQAFAITIDHYDHPAVYTEQRYLRTERDKAIVAVESPREHATDLWTQSADDIEFYTTLIDPMSGPTPKPKRRSSLQLLMHTLLPNSVDGSNSQRKRVNSNTGTADSQPPTSSTSSSALSPTDSYFPAFSPGPASTVATSPRDSPPLDFLLDEDPFANLSCPRRDVSTSSSASTSRLAPPTVVQPPILEPVPIPSTPRSPLMPTDAEIPKKSLARANSTEATGAASGAHITGTKSIAGVGSSPVSGGRERAISGARTPKPAYQRPAFTARPSLPSLTTLSKMNVILTKKVRKGRVGAGLPFEPWDNPDCRDDEAQEPTRVLQDANAQQTEGLPAGTQPLLPSQLVQMSSTSSSTLSTQSPSLLQSTPASTSPTSNFRSRPQLAILTPSLATVTAMADGDSREISPGGSSEGSDFVDSYYSTSQDEDDQHEGWQGSSHGSAGPKVGGSMENTQAETMFISADDPLFSPLSSSGFSSLDLELSPTNSNFPQRPPLSPPIATFSSAVPPAEGSPSKDGFPVSPSKPSLPTSPSKSTYSISPAKPSPATSPSKPFFPISPRKARWFTSPSEQPLLSSPSSGPVLTASPSVVTSPSAIGLRSLPPAVGPSSKSPKVSEPEELPAAKKYHLQESAWYKGSPVSSPTKANFGSNKASPVKVYFTAYADSPPRTHSLEGRASDESRSSGVSYGSQVGGEHASTGSIAPTMTTRSSSEASSSDLLVSPRDSDQGEPTNGWMPKHDYSPFNFTSTSYFPPYPTSTPSSADDQSTGEEQHGAIEGGPDVDGNERHDRTNSVDRVASWRDATGAGAVAEASSSFLSDLDLSDADMDGELIAYYEGAGHGFGSFGYGYGYSGRELEGSYPSSADTVRPTHVRDDAHSRRFRRSILFSGTFGSGSDEEESFGARADGEAEEDKYMSSFSRTSSGSSGISLGRSDSSCSRRTEGESGEEEYFDARDSQSLRASLSSTKGIEDGEGLGEADEDFNSHPLALNVSDVSGEAIQDRQDDAPLFDADGTDRKESDGRDELGRPGIIANPPDAVSPQTALLSSGSGSSGLNSATVISRGQRSLDCNHHHYPQQDSDSHHPPSHFDDCDSILDDQNHDMRFRLAQQKDSSSVHAKGTGDVVDGAGRNGGVGGSDYRALSGSSHDQGRDKILSSSRSNGPYGRVAGNGGHGTDDGNDREGQRRNVDGSATPSDESHDGSEDGLREFDGRPQAQSKTMNGAPQFPASSMSLPRSSAGSSDDDNDDDDDDVPLAQRIPTALKAQKSIRKQVREERLQRRATRGSQAQGESSDAGVSKGRERVSKLRPSGAGGPLLPPTSSAMSSSLEAALLAASGGSSAGAPAHTISTSVAQPSNIPEQHLRTTNTTRQRGLTMPSKLAPPAVTVPFSAEDLSRRLQNVQVSDHPRYQQFPASNASRGPPPPYERHSENHAVPCSRPSLDDRQGPAPAPTAPLSDHQRKRSMKDAPSNPISAAPASRGLRAMRSFNHLERRPAIDPADIPSSNGTTSLSRQPTSARAPPSATQIRSRGDSASATASGAQSPVTRYHSLSVTKSGNSSNHGHAPSSGLDDFGASLPPVPPLPDMAQPSQSRKHLKPHTTSGRASMENERPLVGRSAVLSKSPAVSLSAGLPALDKAVVVQQRVFIGDMQRFNMVEISNSTTAGDVVELLDAQGCFKGIIGTGGWMVWEVAQDFGMERPIRSFEILFDIQASWNKDKTVNMFVLKLTPLSIALSRSAIPSSAPIHSGYVEWESKKGKWSKRWMELREHCLWLSKREGKDEIMLCSLSSFDAYFLTRAHRSPKPFTFAVKSTDNLSYFENAADYLHTFSCSEKDGRTWMEKILVARSYILHQERQVLFNPKSSGGTTSGPSLSRSATTAGRRSTSQRAAQPLISIPPPYAAQPTGAMVFEPGSLLHKQP